MFTAAKVSEFKDEVEEEALVQDIKALNYNKEPRCSTERKKRMADSSADEMENEIVSSKLVHNKRTRASRTYRSIQNKPTPWCITSQTHSSLIYNSYTEYSKSVVGNGVLIRKCDTFLYVWPEVEHSL